MALPNSGQISMLDIYQEKTGFSSGRRDGDDSVFSLTGFSVDGTVVNPGASNNARDFIHDGDINEFRDGTPNSSTPYRMSEFYGYSQVSDTTYDSTLSEQEYSLDSNIIIRPQLRIQYASGNINVNWYPDSENPSASAGTLVYQIVNPASGYTVRETHTETGDGPNNWTYSNIQPNGSAVSVPTSTSFTDWQPEFESEGGYDDPGQNFSTLTVSLIFEKSGETTFTYNFTLDVEIETAGEGGQ